MATLDLTPEQARAFLVHAAEDVVLGARERWSWCGHLVGYDLEERHYAQLRSALHLWEQAHKAGRDQRP